MTVHIPHSLEEALELLDKDNSAALLSGGTDFMVEVNFNHRRPENVISLKQVNELSTWTIDSKKQHIFIGSGVTHHELETGTIAQYLPALAQASRTVGSPQIRAAGTIGGNLGTCSPAGDTLPVLSAMNATVHLASAHQSRSISFDEFMVGPKRSNRQPNEIITGVSVAVPNGWQGYAKVGVRNAMVISVASACLQVHNGEVSIALGSVGPTVIRCREAEKWANSLGAHPLSVSSDDAKHFGELVGSESRPIDDHRSTASYRRHAVGILATRLLQRSSQ